MKEVILVKNGELALKGLNRRSFEDMLMANIRRRLASLGKFTCTLTLEDGSTVTNSIQVTFNRI